MIARQRDRGSSNPATPASEKPQGRKQWKKKTPVEIVMEQAEKVRAQITERESELDELRRQLAKFEEARKIFETS